MTALTTVFQSKTPQDAHGFLRKALSIELEWLIIYLSYLRIKKRTGRKVENYAFHE